MTQFGKWLTPSLAVLALLGPLTVRASPPVSSALTPVEEMLHGNWVADATVKGTQGTFTLTFFYNREARVIFRDKASKVVATKDWQWRAGVGERDNFVLNLGGKQGKLILVSWNHFRMNTTESGWIDFFRNEP